MKAAIPPLGIRLPVEVKDKIKASALLNRRSMNAEIIVALERAYQNHGTNEKADAQA